MSGWWPIELFHSKMFLKFKSKVQTKLQLLKLSQSLPRKNLSGRRQLSHIAGDGMPWIIGQSTPDISAADFSLFEQTSTMSIKNSFFTLISHKICKPMVIFQDHKDGVERHKVENYMIFKIQENSNPARNRHILDGNHS